MPRGSFARVRLGGDFLQNGRIKGEAKKALRAVIEKYGINVVITANQNLILRDVEPAWKADIQATLAAGGVKDTAEWDSIERCAVCLVARKGGAGRQAGRPAAGRLRGEGAGRQHRQAAAAGGATATPRARQLT